MEAQTYNMDWKPLHKFASLHRRLEIEHCDLLYTGSLKGLKNWHTNTKIKKEYTEHLNTIVECYEHKVYRGADSLIISLKLTDEAQEKEYTVNIDIGSSSMRAASIILYRIFT